MEKKHSLRPVTNWTEITKWWVLVIFLSSGDSVRSCGPTSREASKHRLAEANFRALRHMEITQLMTKLYHGVDSKCNYALFVTIPAFDEACVNCIKWYCQEWYQTNGSWSKYHTQTTHSFHLSHIYIYIYKLKQHKWPQEAFVSGINGIVW